MVGIDLHLYAINQCYAIIQYSDKLYSLYYIWYLELHKDCISLSMLVYSPLGDKVSMLTHIYPHSPEED